MKRFSVILFVLMPLLFLFPKNSICDEIRKETLNDELTGEPENSEEILQQEKADAKKEAESLIEGIARGERVEHNGVVFDVSALEKLKKTNEILKNFDIVFDGDKVGLKFHQEYKSSWWKDTPELDYVIEMDREEFANFLGLMIVKEGNSEFNYEDSWGFEEDRRDFTSCPNCFVVDKDGNRTEVAEENKNGSDLFRKVLDVFYEMNKEGIIDVGAIYGVYEEQIKGSNFSLLIPDLSSMSPEGQNDAIGTLVLFFGSKIVNNYIYAKFYNEFLKKELPKYRSYVIREKEIESFKEFDGEHIKSVYVGEFLTGGFGLRIIDENNKVILIRKGESGWNGSIARRNNNNFDDIEGSIWEWEYVASIIDRILTDAQKAELGEDFFEFIEEFIGYEKKRLPVNPRFVKAFENYWLRVCTAKKVDKEDKADCALFWAVYEEKYCPNLREKWKTCNKLKKVIDAEINCKICKANTCSHIQRRLTTEEDGKSYMMCCLHRNFPLNMQ